MDNQITHVDLSGFKAIAEPTNLKLTPINVLIGRHGAGKSNFLSFFRMMNHAMLTPGALGSFVAQQGGAPNLVHHDADADAVSLTEIRADLTFQTDPGEARYSCRLQATTRDTLVFVEEKHLVPTQNPGNYLSDWTGVDAGQTESLIPRESGHPSTPNPIRDILTKTQVYQLETQGINAPIRGRHILTDDRQLRENGGNLAPFLIRLRNQHSWHYQLIVKNLRRLLPFFSDFELAKTPDENRRVFLYWREKDTDRVFSPSQTSDSTIRIMALVTLLLQPSELRPQVMLLDEPCLGLHPDTINLIGGMIRSAARESQIILATQSTTLMDCFEPQDIIVVEREGASSTFHRLDLVKLKGWLDEYSGRRTS